MVLVSRPFLHIAFKRMMVADLFRLFSQYGSSPKMLLTISLTFIGLPVSLRVSIILRSASGRNM